MRGFIVKHCVVRTANATHPPQLLQAKAIAVDNDLRATLRNFGLKVGVVGAVKFEARINELIEILPDWRR